MKRYLTLVLIFVLLAVTNPVEAATIQGNFMTSLSEHWRMEETSGNRTGAAQSYVLTDRNTVTSTTGKRGTAALLTAANLESLDMSDNASTSFTGNFSANYWVNFTSLSAAPNYQCVVSKFASTGTSRSYRFCNSTDTQLLQISSTGSNVSGAGWTTSLSSGTWYMMSVMYSTSGSSTVYINGVSQGSVTGMFTSIFDNATAFEIGKSSSPNEFYVDATVDEVTLWKGRILTSAEVTTLYNAGAGIHWNTEDSSEATVTPFFPASGDVQMGGDVRIAPLAP